MASTPLHCIPSYRPSVRGPIRLQTACAFTLQSSAKAGRDPIFSYRMCCVQTTLKLWQACQTCNTYIHTYTKTAVTHECHPMTDRSESRVKRLVEA